MAELGADDPQWIGGYRLLSRLGAGGMGRVYLARSEGGRTVAVKLIKAELAAEPEFRARFKQEVEAARRVGERWTAPVLDADTDADTPWVATGYIAGPSLERVISGGGGSGKPGPLPEQSIRMLTYGLASALLDIHGAGLIHRDLKPSNVLVTIDGPRVIDFGIVRALDAVPESTMTSTGVVVGSPSYMSPEQIRSEHLTAASDVFCMGAVLAYAATGRPPFGGQGGSGGIHTVMFRIMEEQPDLEGVAEPLRELIAECLAKEAAQRPAPEDVVASVQPISTGTAAAPWLPAGLIAELGRHAVQLLDTDTPPSGSGAPGARNGSGNGNGSGSESSTGSSTPAQPASEQQTTVLPQQAEQGQGQGPAAPGTGRKPHRGRLALAAAAVALVACAGFVASGAEVPLLGSGSKGKSGAADSDVPQEYVGTWAGAVERDGEPTGQYRRFVISAGNEGEVVANSISLGQGYECKSDGKLVSAKKSLSLNTKVVKSVPPEQCSALGSHTLTAKPDGTLAWAAAGRTATLHKIKGAEKIPQAFLGSWQRPLPDGGTQRLTVKQQPVGSAAVTLLSDGPSQHCEAKADLVSAEQPLRVGPPAVNEARSSGDCTTGGSATLRLQGERLVREFPGSAPVSYGRVG